MNTTNQLIRSIRSRWLEEDAPPDALAAVQTHPDLGQDRSALIELAYEEYCLRRAAGEVVDRESYCARFTGCRSALREMLSFDQFIGDNPQLLDESPSADWPLPGDVLCDCVLLRELGHGAFSRVYLAREPAAGDRAVALKVSRLKTGEARTLGRLHHDHVVPIHWARRDPLSGRDVVCMPFLGGATLTDVMDRLYPRNGTLPPRRGDAILDAIAATVRPGDPPPARPGAGPSLHHLTFVQAVARLGRSLAATLAYLHEKGLSHCDLKPSNVLLSPGGQPLLLDFNLSAARQGGTFLYMAPEHLGAFLSRKAMTAEAAASADVYSLGVLLYDLLTGVHPFGIPQGQTEQQCAEAMLALQSRGYCPIQQLNPRVPAALAALIDRCLAPSGASRPKAAEMALALAERRSRRTRSLVSVAVGVLLVLGGLGLANWAVQPPVTVLTHRQRGLDAQKAARELLVEDQTDQAREYLLEAHESFEQAIALQMRQGAKQGAWRDYFERGRTQLLLGDLGRAQKSFLQSETAYRDDVLRPSQALALFGAGQRLTIVPVRGIIARVDCDGQTLAYMSYAHALSANHKEAIAVGTKALEAGVRSPALLNNIGYCHMRLKEIEKAASCFDEALRLDPKLQAGYRNRAMLRLNDKARLAQAIQDIDEAIRLGRDSGRAEPAGLYLQGVQLHARAALKTKNQPRPDHHRHQQRALDYLTRACILGADPGPLLLNDPILKEVLKDPDPRELAALREQSELAAVWTYLVEPGD